jgi:tartrate dehydrogenase/decarboxylase/D-malate dehydrogenase
VNGCVFLDLTVTLVIECTVLHHSINSLTLRHDENHMSNKTYAIALYPGDGIGQEVTVEAVRVLDAIALRNDINFEFAHLPWGVEFFEQHGQVAAANFLDVLESFDAIFLGAVGHPEKLPDHITLAPLVQIRQAFDQYACLRPARLLPGVRSPLAEPGEIDMLVIRENSEGEYVPIGGQLKRGTPQEVAVQTSLHTRLGIERVLRFGFEQAMQRRHHLTLVTKSNALKFSMVLWDDVFAKVRAEYADVDSDWQHVDAAAMNFVRRPDRFDVVVASNLFGDILTDLAGAIIGGLGLAPSANINPSREFPSLFEPVHGSAPDIAGQGIANPIAAIESAAMMMEWLGENQAAQSIHQAVESTLADGHATPDLGGGLKTSEMTNQVLAAIESR